ncbi:Putative AC9 transposase [Linum perenne]
MWTATNKKRGYMAITAHYIDNSWNLRSILVRFLYVLAPHTSARLANRLCTSLLEWNIDKPETKLSDLEGLFSALAIEEEPEDNVSWPTMEPQL